MELEIKDWFILSFGVFFTLIWPFVLYFLKPGLKIEALEIRDFFGECLSVTIKNIRNSKAVNLHVEMCALDGNETYHFQLDRSEFIILPKPRRNSTAHERGFKSYELTEFTQRYFNGTFHEFMELIQNQPGIKVRVRVHANHSYSGFGKAFEQSFRYHNHGFIPI